MQCLGHRGNGETFTADVWFSTYKEGPAPKLAAIIADVTEESTAGASAADRKSQWRGLAWGCIATGIPIGLMLWQRAAVLRASPRAR